MAMNFNRPAGAPTTEVAAKPETVLMEVQPSDNAAARQRLVVLNKIDLTDLALKLLALECLAKISALVAETTRLDDDYAIYFCPDKIHIPKICSKITQF